MSGKSMKRSEFVQNLLSAAVNQPANAHFFAPDAKIQQKMHNPAQDFADFCANFGENRQSNVRTIIDGHLVDISWRRTLEYIRGLAEAEK
jgi:hypothetical protein